MTTDWMVLRRLAAELDRAVRGGRVTDVGLLEDGRFALTVGALRGRAAVTLAVDAFGSPPLVLPVADATFAFATDPGWARTASAAMRGMRVAAVTPRRFDRVVVVELATQSRFGVESTLRLVLELVPRFGNVVLVRDRLVVAAAKQFAPADNEARSVLVGGPYAPPPLPAPSLAAQEFTAALAAEPATWARSLGRYRPACPRLVADSLAAQAAVLPWPSPQALGDWLVERADAIVASTDGRPDALGPVHAYFEGDRLAAVHVVPLAQFATLRHERAPEIVGLLTAARDADRASHGAGRLERRRSALLARIAKRRAATSEEHAAVERRRADAGGRDTLRAAGEALFTHAVEVPPGAHTFVPPTRPGLTIALDPQLDAIANAQRYFARYRKAADALPHLERRSATMAARATALDELAFEAERADAAGLDDVGAALDELEGRPPAPVPNRGKPRAILRFDRPSGARIYVGRSPRENIEVTFRIGRPDDLWFHARNTPGSHVVLQPPTGAAPDDADLAFAADLAATHSKARTSARVEIDYTERKYVRRQRDGAPGAVWYTDARTRVGHPRPS